MGTFSDKLALIITADSAQAVKAIKDVGKQVETTASETTAAGGSLGEGLSAGVVAGAAVAGAAVLALGAVAVKSAASNEEATKRLQVAIQNQGQSYQAVAPAIQATVNKMAALGFTQEDVKNSIARLVPATHDATAAIKLQAVAADVARGAGLDLATATTVIGQAEEGRYRRLIALNVVSNDQIKTMKNSAEVVNFVAAVYKGQAAAATDTLAGKMQVLKAETHNLAASIGQELLPGVSLLVGGLSETAAYANDFQQKANSASGGAVSWGKALIDTSGLLRGDFVNGVKGAGEVLNQITGSSHTAADAQKDLQNATKQLADDTVKYGASSRQVKDDTTALGVAQGRLNVINNQVAKSLNDVGQATDNADAATKAYSASQANLKMDLGNGETFQVIAGDIQDVMNTSYAAVSASSEFANIMAYVKANADLAAGAVINLADAEQLLGTAGNAQAVDSIGAFNKAAAQQFTLDQAVTDAHDQLASATDNLTKKTGGAGGAAKTAAQEWWDHVQRLRAVRDATEAITDDQAALAKAQRDNTLAQNDLATATNKYYEVLHGEAANSLDATNAATNLAAAKDALITANYDVVDAQKEYNTALQSGDPETVARAHVKLDDAQRSQKKATTDLAEAQRVLSGTLHGYAANSVEAQTAQDNLTKAQDKAYESQRALQKATEKTQDDSDNLKRAQLELQGAFDHVNTGGAQSQLDSFAKKMDTVKGDALKFAQAVSESVAFATNDIAAGFQAEIDTLQQVMASNPLLAHAFDGVINNLINAIVKIRTTPSGGQAAFQQQFASGNLQGFALGGIADYPTGGRLAVLHGREAVLPLNDPRRSMDILAKSGLFTTASVSTGGSGGNVYVTMQIEASATTIEDKIYNGLKSAVRRLGPLPGGTVAA